MDYRRSIHHHHQNSEPSQSNSESLLTLALAIDLARILGKLQQHVYSPTNAFERKKLAQSIEYARQLVVHLEEDALTIRTQSQKQETQKSLIQKRSQLDTLAERLQELDELGDDEGEESEEDLLEEDTPDEETETEDHTPPSTEDSAPSPISASEPTIQPSQQPQTQSGGLRNRNRSLATDRAELLRGAPASTTALATSEALMTHNRTQQEALTSGLTDMARSLKERAKAFQDMLEDEKSVLDNAAAGLDRGQIGMEAAQNRMVQLNNSRDDWGWVGRQMPWYVPGWVVDILMFVIIIVLWLMAIGIVFGLPKLRR